MKAIILNNLGVKSIDLPDESGARHDEMVRLIGCRCLTVVAGRPDDCHMAYADDEGMLTLVEGTSLVQTTFHEEWLAGNIIITGFDNQTLSDLDCTLTATEVYARIKHRAHYSARRAS